MLEERVLRALCMFAVRMFCGRMYGPEKIAHGDGLLSRFFPSGWSKIAKNWDGLCSYTAHHGGSKALCNVPRNTHAWKLARQAPKFMCGKIEGGAFKGMHTHARAPMHLCVCAPMRTRASAHARAAHVRTIMDDSVVRCEERRAGSQVQVPDREGIEHLGQISRHHGEGLCQARHEAGVRPPELLQDR